MEIKLLVLEGKNAGRAVPVKGPKFFVGRADDCQLRPASDLVSRHHCVIVVESGFVSIRDFGSKNGTFVNDERVAGEQELKSGDRLTIGSLKFEVQLTVSVGGEKKPKVESVEEAAVRTAASPPPENLSGEDDSELDEWIGLGDHPGPTEDDTRTVDVLDMLDNPKPDGEKKSDQLPGQKEDSGEPKVVGISAKRAKMITAATSRGAAEEALKKLLRGGR